MNDAWLEHSKQEYEEFLALINKYMDLKKWGFIQTYSRVLAEVSHVIVFDSEWCRVRFSYERRDHGNPTEREASVWYGKLYASNDDAYINLDGEEAICWHGLYYYVLDFLDGLSPREVIEHIGRGPRIVYEFQTRYPNWELWGDPRTAYAIKDLRMHNEIWEHYGQKLFELFDVRNHLPWGKYVQFHNEIKRLQYEAWVAKERLKKPFKQIDDFEPDNLC